MLVLWTNPFLLKVTQVRVLSLMNNLIERERKQSMKTKRKNTKKQFNGSGNPLVKKAFISKYQLHIVCFIVAFYIHVNNVH